MSDGKVAEDGAFKVEGISADKYYLNFYGLPEGSYVRSARMGGQEVLDNGLDLTQSEGSVKLEITLSPKAGVIEGVVQGKDKKPAPGAWVTLVPEPARPELRYLYKSASSDQNGRFGIKGVAPGDYKLYAWEEPVFNPFSDPDLFKPFETKGVKVSLQENKREQAELMVLKPEDAQTQ